MRGLRGKTVVVAGGATGIGAASCFRLAAEGANVVVGDINLAGAIETAAEITAAGGTAVAVEFDLASEPTCTALVEAAVDRFGSVEGCFNVGADLSAQTLGRDGNVLEVELEVWTRTLDVNLTGYFHIVRAALPHMLRAQSGSIVNMSSGVSNGSERHVSYGVSKAGVISLSRHIARAFGKRGIRCNVIDPGLTITRNQLESISDEEREALLPTVNASRFGVPEDSAAMVAFLMSDDATWINGQAYPVSSMSRGIS